MSFFSRFFARSPRSAPAAGPEQTPVAPAPTPARAPAVPPDANADLKKQRHDHRERLYEVVRSVMLRSEVLASSYKFKVLSLDTRGRQFLVMIDLLGENVLPPDRWMPIEQLMALMASQRHDLQVKSVYWRVVMPMVAGAALPGAGAAPDLDPGAPPPAAGPQTTTSPLTDPAASPPARKPAFDPIGDEEMRAFQKALAPAAPQASQAEQSGKLVSSGPRKPRPQPGYEDTQLLETDDAGSALSGTQFGGLN